MKTKAILFGSIGAVAETSEIQREAYNRALKNAGLQWEWDRETYSELLEQAGGKERLRMLAHATGTDLDEGDIEAIHEEKTRIAGEIMRERGVSPRPGITDLIAKAREAGGKLGFVTTTYEPNIEAVFDAAGDALNREDFAYIGTRGDVSQGKPSPECYERALSKLGLNPGEAIAVEDTATSVQSAKRAGIATIATPGELTANQDFWQADVVVERGNGEALVREVKRIAA
ncbi:HAD family hydrolase [Erythrobacter sp.]|uniref:HAD family hydrolase n=1 Tax=Erythrobacter sp. TaxID=1042 RepID=UPI002EB15FD0|nr:HAD-IA family hydrolase [Erythrobacter sp.]